MTKFILGRKGRMTQIFTENGVCVPVTIIEAGPCWVTALRSKEAGGYDAVQYGFEEAREKVLSKAEVGHAKKAGAPALRNLRELRLKSPAELELGAVVKADVFAVGDQIDVAGLTKGRGFSGAMKRYNFGGGPMTHGGMCRRWPGSIGMHSYPARVFKGKRMAGHYGVERVKVKNLRVMAVDVERNLLVVSGAVPGHRGSLLEIRSAVTPRKQAKA